MATGDKANGAGELSKRAPTAPTKLGRGYGILFCLLLVGLVGCSREPQEVVVYTALDEVFSQPILDQFAAETGSKVLVKGDTESTKTVGLAQAIISERDRPRCDLFWNN
ncbi:MAG: hypothetical protein ACR2NU_09820, partial [Aeoliella sp.]